MTRALTYVLVAALVIAVLWAQRSAPSTTPLYAIGLRGMQR